MDSIDDKSDVWKTPWINKVLDKVEAVYAVVALIIGLGLSLYLVYLMILTAYEYLFKW